MEKKPNRKRVRQATLAKMWSPAKKGQKRKKERGEAVLRSPHDTALEKKRTPSFDSPRVSPAKNDSVVAKVKKELVTCPACTLYNEPGARTCRMCNTDLAKNKWNGLEPQPESAPDEDEKKNSYPPKCSTPKRLSGASEDENLKPREPRACFQLERVSSSQELDLLLRKQRALGRGMSGSADVGQVDLMVLDLFCSGEKVSYHKKEDFDKKAFEDVLSAKLSKKLRKSGRETEKGACVMVKLLPEGYRPLVFWRGDEKTPFIKVVVNDSRHFSSVIDIARKCQGTFPGLAPDHWHRDNQRACLDPRYCCLQYSTRNNWPVYSTYEGSVTHLDRFMADTEIGGGTWIRVSGMCHKEVPERHEDSLPKIVNVAWSDPDSRDEKHLGPTIDILPERLDYAPLRILAIAVDKQGNDIASVVFVLDWAEHTDKEENHEENQKVNQNPESTPLTLLVTTEPNVEHTAKYVKEQHAGVVRGGKVWVVTKASEKDLILAAAEIIKKVDPDVITGYDVASNEFAAMFQCAEKLSLENVKAISRVRGKLAAVKKFQTYGGRWVRQGRRMSHISNEESSYLKDLHGRVLLDVKKIVQGAFKLETYTIRSSTAAVMGDDSFEAKSLDSAREGWRATVARARASFEMLQKLEALNDTVELGRATGLSLESVWTKGQLARVWSLLLRACRKEKFLVTDRAEGGRGSMDRLEVGPLVLDCVKVYKTQGLHVDPVVVLDFSSMYPSIMIAHNLCFSTLICGDPPILAAHEGQCPGATEDSGEYQAPVDFLVNTGIFRSVSQTSRPKAKKFRFAQNPKGVLPIVLRHLLQARAAVKMQLKNAVSKTAKSILDSRQKALKVCANAVYGFTGTSASKVFIPALAETVLMTGVKQLLTAAIETKNIKNVKVIYGDTDSLMIKCLGQTKLEAKATGEMLSSRLSALFPKPCSMKLESIFLPFLLQHNKHYAGVENGKLTIKGMEAVSRGTLPVLRRLYNEVLKDLLLLPGRNESESGSRVRKELVRPAVRKALKRVIDTGRQLLKGKCEMADLVLTRALWMDDTDIKSENEKDKGQYGRGQYKVSQPHVSVAHKRRKRGERINKGERVSFVLIHPESGSDKMHEMAEDPIYAKKNQLPLNYRHYVDNLLLGPLKRLFELPGILGDEIPHSREGDEHEMRKENRQREKNRKAAEKAFLPLQQTGEKKTFSPFRGIGKFFKAKQV